MIHDDGSYCMIITVRRLDLINNKSKTEQLAKRCICHVLFFIYLLHHLSCSAVQSAALNHFIYKTKQKSTKTLNFRLH